MKRALYTCALLVLGATTAACSFKIFEDIGSDPHPPTVAILSLVHYVPPEPSEPPPEPPPELPPDAARATVLSGIPPERTIEWNSGGFTLTPGQKFQIERAYTDAGGDIVKFVLRDRDGALQTDITPADQTYYGGTSGVVLGPTDGIELTGVAGPHRLELWAEDSHLSRSEKVAFVINLVL